MEVSIIITNYNYEKYVSRAIRSAVNQSFTNEEYEIIVVDDNSTDKSRLILEQHQNHIRLILNDSNLGLAASCNKAVKEARGKFIYFLDADDFINKDTILVCHSFISHNKDSMDAVSSDYYEVNMKETVIRRRDGMAFPIRCGTLFYTDHLLELGPYDVNIKREDIDFRKRFLQSGRFIYNLPVPYYRYTQHNESITKQ